MKLDQLAQIGNTITDHWPGILVQAAHRGQRIADAACGLLDELYARQQGRNEPFRVSDMSSLLETKESKERKLLSCGHSRASIVKQTISTMRGPFTAADVLSACPDDMDICRNDISTIISQTAIKGQLRKVKYATYERVLTAKPRKEEEAA